MRVLFVYNEHDNEELKLSERAISELSTYIKPIPLNEVSPELKSLISSTPIIIPILDSLQGLKLKGEGVDGQLIIVATVYKWLEKEEEVVHNQQTKRLDVLIDREVTTRYGQEKTQLENKITGIGKQLVQEKLKNAAKGGNA